MSHESRTRTLDTGNLEPLQDWLAAQLGAEAVTIDKAELLAGGAIGENWRLDVSVFGSTRAGSHRWVLRTDAASPLAMSLDRAHEFACLRAAHDAGVLVPEPIADCAQEKPIGAPFMVTGHLDGYAQGFRIVRDPAIEQNGDALVETLGRQLARIHNITPPHAGLEFLPVPDISPALAQVRFMRDSLDGLSEARPTLEYILCWLQRNAPDPERLVLCHSDFRTGNFMAQDGALTGAEFPVHDLTADTDQIRTVRLSVVTQTERDDLGFPTNGRPAVANRSAGAADTIRRRIAVNTVAPRNFL